MAGVETWTCQEAQKKNLQEEINLADDRGKIPMEKIKDSHDIENEGIG